VHRHHRRGGHHLSCCPSCGLDWPGMGCVWHRWCSSALRRLSAILVTNAITIRVPHASGAPISYLRVAVATSSLRFTLRALWVRPRGLGIDGKQRVFCVGLAGTGGMGTGLAGSTPKRHLFCPAAGEIYSPFSTFALATSLAAKHGVTYIHILLANSTHRWALALPRRTRVCNWSAVSNGCGVAYSHLRRILDGYSS
jgi:hypothetical protein